MTVIVYVLGTTALYYLGSRAKLTRFLWSKYPRWLDNFMLCAACSGAWYALGLALIGAWRKWDFLGLPGNDPVTVIAVVLGGIVWTPIVAALHLWALDRVSVAEPDDDTPEGPKDADA